MFGQRLSLSQAVLGAVVALTLTAAPALAAHGGGHAGGFHGGGFHGGSFHGGGYHGGGYHGGFSGYHGGYGGYHGGYGGYHGGYGGYHGYYGGYGGYRGGYGYGGYRGYYGGYHGYRGGYYGGYWPGYYGLGLGLGAYPSYYDNSYYDNYYTPPVVDYSAPSYYVTPSASTTVVVPDMPPSTDDYAPASADDRAHVEVMVPSPDAQVLFDGHQTRQTGTDRQFVSPPLTPGQTYHYTVEARWDEGGRMVDQTRTVTVTAGQAATVDFTR